MIALKFKHDFFILSYSYNVASRLPDFLSIFLELQLQLISRNKPHIIFFRENESSDSLLVQAELPFNFDVILSLLLLKLFVIISFQLDERLKNLFVLLRILISQQNLLERFLFRFLLKVVNSSLRLFLPHILQIVDLLDVDLPAFPLFEFRRRFDQPVDDHLVLKKRRPVLGVPVAVLNLVETRLSTKENDDDFSFGSHKAEDKSVLIPTMIALKRGLYFRLLVQLETLMLRFNHVKDSM